MAIIEIEKLTHCYNSYPAVNALTCSVERGSVVGLLGPNGAGKSTTIKMLTTLLPPTTGRATIMGYDLVQDAAKIRQNIGYVPQLVSADGELTGYENLQLCAKLYGLTSAKREKSIDEVIEFMRLSDFRDELVRNYSGGMVRRLEIAQALIHSPKVLFLDEPSVGLDPSARLSLWRHIKEWQQKFSTTILLTTHDMDEADVLCDMIVFMHRGRKVAQDSPQQLKQHLGPKASLEDVFLHYTGETIEEELYGDLSDARRVRRAISKRG